MNSPRSKRVRGGRSGSSGSPTSRCRLPSPKMTPPRNSPQLPNSRPKSNSASRLSHAVGREPPVALEDVEVLPLDEQARHDEPVRGVADRLVELGAEQRVGADLQVALPLRAVAVHFRHLGAHAGAETVAALEVVLQFEAEAQEVRAPALAPRADLDAGQHALAHQAVVERLEIVAAVEVREALVHLLGVERLADDRAELGLDALAVALGALVGAHEVHDRLLRLAPGCAPRRSPARPHPSSESRAEPLGARARRGKPEADGAARRRRNRSTAGSRGRARSARRRRQAARAAGASPAAS